MENHRPTSVTASLNLNTCLTELNESWKKETLTEGLMTYKSTHLIAKWKIHYNLSIFGGLVFWDSAAWSLQRAVISGTDIQTAGEMRPSCVNRAKVQPDPSNNEEGNLSEREQTVGKCSTNYFCLRLLSKWLWYVSFAASRSMHNWRKHFLLSHPVLKDL